MSKKKSTNPRDTIGKIAKEYGYDVRTFFSLVGAYVELKAEIDLHTKSYRHPCRKIIPPILIDKIFATLGEPS